MLNTLAGVVKKTENKLASYFVNYEVKNKLEMPAICSSGEQIYIDFQGVANVPQKELALRVALWTEIFCHLPQYQELIYFN